MHIVWVCIELTLQKVGIMFHHTHTPTPHIRTIRHVVVYGYKQGYINCMLYIVQYTTLNTIHLNPRTVLHVRWFLLLLPITCQHGYDSYAKYNDKKKTQFSSYMYKEIQKGAVAKSSSHMTKGLLIYD
jgi:hypothetical protein